MKEENGAPEWDGQRKQPSVSLLAFLLISFGIVIHIYFSYSPSIYTTTTETDLNGNAKTRPLLDKNFSAPSHSELVGVTPTENMNKAATNNSVTQKGKTVQGKKCDLFRGEWIPDSRGPYYSNESCKAIQEDQNCMKHGRPDTGYLYWRWKPEGCHLPRFNGTTFFNIVRNKVLGFIGDSIARNNVQSLLCMLSQVDDPMDMYHDEAYLFRRWYFPSYNFTLVVLWSPYLVKKTENVTSGSQQNQINVNLDIIDENWKHQLHEFDFVILSGGKWFYKSAIYLEKNEIVGCHYCQGMNLTEIEISYAYRKALRTAFKFINSSPHYNGLTFFRTFISDHFENGQWFSGGTCKRTVPFKNVDISMEYIDAEMLKIELEEFEEAVKEGSERGLKFKLLDTSQAALLRPDGHPGPYRYYYPFANDSNAKVQNDCLHWCLPGPIDTWSEILLEILQQL